MQIMVWSEEQKVCYIFVSKQEIILDRACERVATMTNFIVPTRSEHRPSKYHKFYTAMILGEQELAPETA